PNMGHDPKGRRHSTPAWLSLITAESDVVRGRKLVVQLAETYQKGGQPVIVESLDAVQVGKASGMPIAPVAESNGSRVCVRYGVAGARGEAATGFPHVANIGLPALRAGRGGGLAEEDVRLDVLMSIMASLDDTCLLHRGGRAALTTARRGARALLEAGGASTAMGCQALFRLDAELLALNALPGGSADLLAAVLFLDQLGARPERMLRPSSSWR